jgi:hypothetical protein
MVFYLGSSGHTPVRVRVPPSAPQEFQGFSSVRANPFLLFDSSAPCLLLLVPDLCLT